MNNKKLIILVIVLLDLIVIGVLCAYFFVFKKVDKHEVVFAFENNLKEITTEVNAREVDKIAANVMIDGVDKSDLIQIDDSNVDTTKLGTYEMIYYVIFNEKRYEDKVIINVVDTTKPEIILNGGKVIMLLNEKYEDPGYDVKDNYDTDLKDKVEIKNEVDNTKEGTYKIIYKVSDSSGNSSEVVREVTIKKPNVIVATPPKEQKVEVPKVVETTYDNTIKKNKFNNSNVVLEGYLKEVLDENKIKFVDGEKVYEYNLNMNGNNYTFNLNPEGLDNGNYKVYINDEVLLNKMAPVTRLNRAKVGNRLVTFSYNNDEVNIKIENHAYAYDILINPGHGGWDSGAVNEYAYEKDMNLKVSMYEKCRYEAHGLRVYMTRTSDTYGVKMGPSGLIDLHKVAYEMGHYGAVSKIVYSNHHNSIGNNYYNGYEVLIAGEIPGSELANEKAIANKWNSIFPSMDNHTRFYARDYDTERIYSKWNGEVYSFKNNYAVNRIPYETANVKSIIYEGCYMSNKDEFKWYWLNSNWYKVSEAKIEVYVKSLGLSYNSDNSSCIS